LEGGRAGEADKRAAILHFACDSGGVCDGNLRAVKAEICGRDEVSESFR
jgi:hypothetical protein